MTKLHKAHGGVFTRCRATVRQGQGVKDCPLEVEGVEVSHVVGLKGIAEAGGGIMRKPLGNGKYRDTYIMALPDGGYMTSTGHQERIYDRTGKLVPEIERRRQCRREQREGKLPELNAMEQWQVDEEYAALKEHVTQGLLHWDVPNVMAQFASDARTASVMAERGVFTSAGLALLLEVSNRPNAPLELTHGLNAVKEQITDEPDPCAYLTQKAREEKRDRLLGPIIDREIEATRQAWSEIPSYKRRSVESHVASFEAGSVDDLMAFIDHARRDELGSTLVWDAALEKATGKSIEHLTYNRNRNVLNRGDVDAPYWRTAYIAWQNETADGPRRRDQIRRKFGDKATDVENWLFEEQRPTAAKQRNLMVSDLQKHFAKQGKAQKFTLGSPSLDKTEITKDHLIIHFSAKKHMMDQVREIADEGNFKEFQVHQYKPTTSRMKGYVVITPIRASFDELVDLM